MDLVLLDSDDRRRRGRLHLQRAAVSAFADDQLMPSEQAERPLLRRRTGTSEVPRCGVAPPRLQRQRGIRGRSAVRPAASDQVAGPASGEERGSPRPQVASCYSSGAHLPAEGHPATRGDVIRTFSRNEDQPPSISANPACSRSDARSSSVRASSATNDGESSAARRRWASAASARPALASKQAVL